MSKQELETVAQAMVAKGKGILAADESAGTIKRRFDGIKIDKGRVEIPSFPGETVTEGLDGLRARVKEYKDLGAKFAKWRAVITIGDAIPTYTCLEANAHALARYAALCQEGGLVPIVEPEALLDGNHTVERCHEVTEQTLKVTFTALFLPRVHLEGMIL